ncbi:FecR family protein [Pedobacter soli]|uniref:FecR family protein n=1 Tax=Pedobacter soli TaxID=390242 RepID=A0A1G7AB93_9SPHI|nr:FecR family protein [Pedobacter soli]SDE11315.1 FecR family protein [Pedobacter soli]
MKEEAFELSALISGYLLCTLTPQEEERLKLLLAADEERYRILEAYRAAEPTAARLSNMDSVDVDQAWHKVNNRFQTPQVVQRKNRYGWLKYAAILIAVIGVFLFYFNLNKADPGIVADITKTYQNDVLPGTQTAKLILSDGTQITLDKEKQIIGDEKGTTIVSNQGEISYGQSATNALAATKFNTLIVPKAGTYKVTLPDGSKVMLNAMSELEFPVSFADNERLVSLKGEAYFEVAKDAARPFKVKLNGSEVEVLGTHFNVSAYNQTAKTTLLEGSVKVRNGESSSILVPGKQALSDQQNIVVAKGDLDKAVAWCKGDFYFSNDALEPVLTEISRWYDLKLIYKTKIPEIHITGHVSRKAKLSEVLDMLKDVSNRSFGIEGRNLIIN